MKSPNLASAVKQLTIILFTLIFFSSAKINAQFAYGADIGWLSEMEANNYVFKNSSGVTENCMEILKEKGINALRFRVWVNPSNRYCSKEDVVYMAQRADSMGFRVMLDFHLSDTWADPGHQTKPAAWSSHTFSELLTDVYNHVYDVLDTLKLVGVTPAWVQIGNETNDGTLWEDGRASKSMSNFAKIINSGYNAAKSVDSTIQVIVHLSDGHDNSKYRWMFDGLKYYGAKWDIIGMSVYPYWAGLTWEVDDSLALINMNDMISRYKTKVMVCEAGYLYNYPTSAKNYLLDLIEKTKSAGGLGVFYWEPESYNWRGYQMGAWNPSTKQPTAAMDAFLESQQTTSVKKNEIPEDYNLGIYPNPFNPATKIVFSISEETDVKIKIYNSLGKEIKILLNENKTAGNYTIEWNGTDSNNRVLPSGVYFVRLSSGKNSKVIKTVLLK